MKKLLNISVIAALAVLPMAANATPTYGSVPAEPVDATANTNVASTSFVRGAYNAAVAVANAEYQRATGVEGTLSNLTTTDKSSLVNAINELTDSENIGYDNTTSGLTADNVQDAIDEIAGTAGSAIQEVQVNGTALTPANGAVNVTVAEGSTNGTVAVNGVDVDVHGLGSAAFVNTGALADTAGTYDNTGSGLTATTIQDAIDEVAGSVATQSAKVLKVYTTWNTDTNQEVTLTNPTPAQQGD